MADTISRGLAIGLAVVVVGLGVQQWSASETLESLLTEVEELRDEVATRPAPVVVSVPNGMFAKQGKARKSKVRKRDNEPKGRRHRRRERIQARAERLRADFAVFADERGIEEETGALVIEELQLAKEATALVRSEIQDGTLTGKAGRAEILEIRADTDAALVELLGPDTSSDLKVQLSQWFGPKEEP